MEGEIIAKAFRCDLCNKYTDYIRNVGGLDFKIGKRRDEFTGKHDKMKEVREVCPDCHEKILNTVKELYEQATTEQ